MKDKLLDCLMKYKFPNWPQNTDTFLVKTRYSKLKEAIDATDYQNGISSLSQYLKYKWYSDHKDAPWHDAHRNEKENVNVYFGYWAWEAAALVKVKGWQDRDEELKKSKYYPYRAAHW